MTYKKDELYRLAEEVITNDSDVVFVEDVISQLPCSKPTFYDCFPVDSDDFNKLRALLNNNKVNIKKNLRHKWKESDNATLQLALYRLTSSPEEHKLLNNTSDFGDDGSKKITVVMPTIKINDKEMEFKVGD